MKHIIFLIGLLNVFLLQGSLVEHQKDAVRQLEWNARIAIRREERAAFCLIGKMLNMAYLEPEIEQKIAEMYKGPLHQSWPDEVPVADDRLYHQLQVKAGRDLSPTSWRQTESCPKKQKQPIENLL